MDTTSGLRARRSINSRQITSEATVDPPGLSTRSTAALMLSSLRTSRMYSVSLSEPTSVPVGPVPPLPETMVPTA